MVDDVQIPAQPSPAIFQCCCNIVNSARQLSMDLLNEPEMTRIMQESYLSIVIDSLQTLKLDQESRLQILLQTILDLEFLKLLTGFCSSASAPVFDAAVDILTGKIERLSLDASFLSLYFSSYEFFSHVRLPGRTIMFTCSLEASN
jgi:hypothetical protein